jgi:benzoyl-CoA reductase/2-hydroxyglutaryl-CoA dehydratase subunit BcrC/BadD/HgdB
MSRAIIEKLAFLSEQNLAAIEKAKDQGRKVAGLYCLYAPVELVVAAGGLSPCRFAARAKIPSRMPRSFCPGTCARSSKAASVSPPLTPARSFIFRTFLLPNNTCKSPLLHVAQPGAI